MRKVEAIIATVEAKVHQLGEQKLKAEQELSSAREKLQRMEEKMAELKSQIADLEEKNRVIQVAQSLNSGEGSTDARKRINELVREIDKCIALLNK